MAKKANQDSRDLERLEEEKEKEKEEKEKVNLEAEKALSDALKSAIDINEVHPPSPRPIKVSSSAFGLSSQVLLAIGTKDFTIPASWTKPKTKEEDEDFFFSISVQ